MLEAAIVIGKLSLALACAGLGIALLRNYYGFFSWAWKRLTGWRDAYGRKAHLFLPWH